MIHVPIIDSGHGYNTPGKRSEGFNDSNGNVLLKENSVNEAVANKLSLLYYLNNKEAHFISNEWLDISLDERVDREKKIASKLKKEGKKSMFISIHADAFHIKNKAFGGRFFYYSNSGKAIADFYTKYFKENGYQLSLREPAKANYKVIKFTNSPAVLFEMGFMTSKADLDVLLSDDFRNSTAMLLYQAERAYSSNF